MTNNLVLLRQRIMPFTEGDNVVRAPYGEAHRRAVPYGGLPLNRLADRLLLDEAYRKTLKPEDRQAAVYACPLWIGEMVVLRPPEGFLPGQSIHDFVTGYTFPASAVPDEALYRPIHLLVRPSPEWKGEVEVVPASVTLLHGLPASGEPGRVDSASGFPYKVSKAVLAGLSPKQIRFASYDGRFTVAPVSRDHGCNHGGGVDRYVGLDRPPNHFSVSRVAIDLIELAPDGALVHEHLRDLPWSVIVALSRGETPEASAALNVVLKTLNQAERVALAEQAVNLLAA